MLEGCIIGESARMHDLELSHHLPFTIQVLITLSASITPQCTYGTDGPGQLARDWTGAVYGVTAFLLHKPTHAISLMTEQIFLPIF